VRSAEQGLEQALEVGLFRQARVKRGRLDGSGVWWIHGVLVLVWMARTTGMSRMRRITTSADKPWSWVICWSAGQTGW
jgi:hypothetical protein